jgi:ParB/RepB/Spo0J family partition protein
MPRKSKLSFDGLEDELKKIPGKKANKPTPYPTPQKESKKSPAADYVEDIGGRSAACFGQTAKVAKVPVREIPIEKVEVHPLNRRLQAELTLDNCAEDIQSIRTHGQTTPIEVIQSGSKYLAIAGSRRLFSMRALHDEDPGKYQTIRGVTHPEGSLSDAQIVARSWSENEHRSELTIWESALYVESTMELLPEASQEEIAQHLGKSNAWVSIMRRLLDLDLPGLGLSGKDLNTLTYAKAQKLATLATQGKDRVRGAVKEVVNSGAECPTLFARVIEKLDGRDKPPPQIRRKRCGDLAIRVRSSEDKLTIDLTGVTIEGQENRDWNTIFRNIEQAVIKLAQQETGKEPSGEDQ